MRTTTFHLHDGRTGRGQMTVQLRALVGLLALSSATFVATPAFASTHSIARRPALKTISFTGHYSGSASLLIDNGNVTISSVSGTGTGTLVGASSVSGSGSSSAAAQCDPFGGTGAIAGPSATIRFKVLSSSAQGCSSGESGPVTVTFHGTAKAIGGTGRAKGASGSLKFHGTLQLGGTSGSQTGTYTVKLTGSLNVK